MSPDRRELRVAPAHEGLTLDEFLAVSFQGHSLKALRRLVADGKVRLNGEGAGRGDLVREGDEVSLDLAGSAEPRYRREAGASRVSPELEVLFEDEHLLAIAKPAGLAVGAEREPDAPLPIMDLLLDYAARRSPFGAERRRPRLVHRLDRDTTGALLVAMTADAARELSGAFEDGAVAKTYHALVRGRPLRAEGEIDRPIRPASRGNVMELGAEGGKEAFTAWRVLEPFRDYALLEARPRTGRTHQIRVHLASIGHPLVVDPIYGGSAGLLLSSFKRAYKPSRGRDESPLIGRLTLHAAGLAFEHPATKAPMSVEAPWPEDFERAMKQLRKWGK